jgi:hypothetical protein
MEPIPALLERTERPMTKVASILFAGALAANAAPQTFTGAITDTMCGKDHAMMKVSPDAKCVVECVKHDKNNKYALFDGKNVYALSDQKTPEQFAGKKVTVTGTLYEKTKILKVDSIAEEENSPASAPAGPGRHSGHQH